MVVLQRLVDKYCVHVSGLILGHAMFLGGNRSPA